MEQCKKEKEKKKKGSFKKLGQKGGAESKIKLRKMQLTWVKALMQ
jgi:hypothetical protein